MKTSLRSPEIAPHLDRRHPRGEGCGGPAAGSARRSLEVPGVVRAAEDGVVRVEPRQHGGHVGLPHQHAARRLEPCRHGPIPGGHVVGQRREACGRAHPGRLVAVLQGVGHAVEWAPHLSARERLIGLAGPAQGALGIERDDGIERGVPLLDARQMRLDHLARRDRAGSDGPGQLKGAREDDVHRIPPVAAACAKDAIARPMRGSWRCLQRATMPAGRGCGARGFRLGPRLAVSPRSASGAGTSPRDPVGWLLPGRALLLAR